MNPSYRNLMNRALYEPQTLSETEKRLYLFLLKNNTNFKKEVEKLVMKRVGEKLRLKEQEPQTTRTYTLEEIVQHPLTEAEVEALNSKIATYYAGNPELERAVEMCTHLRNNIPLTGSRANGSEMAKPKQVLSLIVQLPLDDNNYNTELPIQLSEALNCRLVIRIINNQNEIVQESILEPMQTELSIPLAGNLTIGLYYCVISPMISSPKDFALIKEYGTETRRFYIHKEYAPDIQA